MEGRVGLEEVCDKSGEGWANVLLMRSRATAGLALADMRLRWTPTSVSDGPEWMSSTTSRRFGACVLIEHVESMNTFCTCKKIFDDQYYYIRFALRGTVIA